MPFKIRTSIHGRRLAITSTAGIGSLSTDSTSIGVDQVAQMWGGAMVQTVSSGGAAVVNHGLTVVSSLSTGGMAALVLGTPFAGVRKQLSFITSASLLTLETSATTILFASGGSSLLTDIGSTILTIGSAAFPGIFGTSITLVGLSTTIWSVLGRSSSNLVSS